MSSEVNLQESQRLAKVLQIQARLANAEFDLTEFMNMVVKELQELTPAAGVVIELVDGDDMVYRAASGNVESYLGLRLPRENSISGLCVKNNEVLCSHDTETDSRVNLEACRKVKARSLVVAPLFNAGIVVGVLKIMADVPNAFNEVDIQTLQLVAGFLGTAIANQQLQEIKNFF